MRTSVRVFHLVSFFRSYICSFFLSVCQSALICFKWDVMGSLTLVSIRAVEVTCWIMWRPPSQPHRCQTLCRLQLYLTPHRASRSNLGAFWNVTTGDSLILRIFPLKKATNRCKKSGNSTNSCLSFGNPVTSPVNMKRCKHGNKHFLFRLFYVFFFFFRGSGNRPGMRTCCDICNRRLKIQKHESLWWP